MTKLLGKKIGMTHVFTKEGKRCPVTVIDTELTDDLKDLFKTGDFVDVTALSKGKGFQGGMKRWNWSGTPKTHGSTSHRRVGSIGSSATPSRVFKGRHMPGHMGNQKVTIQNLQVVKLDKENNLLAIKGAVPGHRNSKLVIKKAKKKAHLRKEISTEAKTEPKPGKKEVEAKVVKESQGKAETKSEVKAETKAKAKTETKTKEQKQK